ncbi:hypothetical protein GCM10009744_12070 [Kribbella alba]|uniref:Peptidase S33 tripeptidyl aminopeptidase-like C-terminal domain-containing protein n=1 Tax=Kribbella alba TaxID=190197 RepID=A0ABN2F2M8_9ACTN
MSAARRNTGLLLCGKGTGRRAATVAAGKLANRLWNGAGARRSTRHSEAACSPAWRRDRPAARLRIPGTPMLVFGTKHDPATPYQATRLRLSAPPA